MSGTVRRPSTGYGMPAVSEDPTDKSDQDSSSHFFAPRKHDLIPLVLAILSIVICLTAGLTACFLLANNNHQDAINGLNTIRDQTVAAYGAALKSTSLVIDAAAALFQLSKTPVTLNDQFAPYMSLFMSGSSQSMGAYMTYITYSQLVPYNDTDAFVASMRSLGGDYANFTVTAKYTAAVRDVITEVVPTTYMRFLNGYDRGADATKTDTRNRAIASGKTCVSGRSTIVGRGDQQVGATFMKAIYNTTTGDATSLITAVVTMSTLTDAVLASFSSYDLTVSIMDTNATVNDTYGGLFYSTAPTTGNDSVILPAANAAMIANAPFTSIGYVALGDRVLQVILIPGSSFVGSYDSFVRYIALIICLLIMVVLLTVCAFIYFVRKLLVARKSRANAEFQIDLLKTNQTSLRSLLERIATQEEKQRSTINAFPDYVMVVSDSGKLLQTNTAFDDDFPFTAQELEKGVYTFNVFTDLASDFYRTAGDAEITTTAARRFGDYMDVQLRVRHLAQSGDKESSSLSNDFKSKLSGSAASGSGPSIVQSTEDEAYLIIAKNVSEKKEDSITVSTKRSELEKKFRDPYFRADLRLFCEKEKNVENILFLEAVRDYKKAPFAERVDMKKSIFERFIKDGAPMQLNLANNLVVDETIKISKCIADVDVFSAVEQHVFKTLEGDIYPRFQEKNSSRDVSPSSHVATPLHV